MNFFNSPISEEEQKKIIAIRSEFANYLQTEQSRTTNSQLVGELSPESAEQLYALIKTQQSWLEKNKSAKYIEIYSQLQACKDGVKSIKDVDKPRRSLYQQLDIYPYVLAIEQKNNPSIFKEKALQTALADLQKPYMDWYEKNKKQSTTTLIQYNDQQTQFYKAITDAATTYSPATATEVKNILLQNLRAVQSLTPTKYEGVRAQFTAKVSAQEKEKDAQGLTYSEMGWESVSLATKIFGFGFLFVFAMLGGSFAANSAITQNSYIRILFFIYGTLFFPITLLYTLFMRIYKGPIDWYAFLPLTNHQGTTALSRFFLSPFYWIQDESYLQKVAEEKQILQMVIS